MVAVPVPELHIDQFNNIFPFHILVDKDLRIQQTGKSLGKIIPGSEGRPLDEYFEVFRPTLIELCFDQLKDFRELLILKTKGKQPLLYRCQIEFLEHNENILLLGSPWFRSMDEVKEKNLTLNDFSISDSMIDLLHVLKTEEIVSMEVRELLEKIKAEKLETEKLAQRMNSLFQHATEGVILTDHEGVILLVNPAACKMFHYDSTELLGKKIEMLIPDPLKQGHEQHRGNFLKDPVNRKMGDGRDLRAQRKDGSTFSVEVSLSTYIQENERFVIGFIIDITRRKETEQNMMRQQAQLEKVTSEMRRLNAELEAKVEERTIILKEALQRLEQSQQELSEALDKEKQLNEIKGRFVSMASHEFRTPLSTVLSSATLLAKYKKEEEQPQREKHIGKIRESVKHLNTLLEEFLSLGKLEEGKIAAKKEEFNLKELILDTIYEMSEMKKEGQEIELEYSGHEIVFSDKMLFKNILINLFSNAIKFSEKNRKVLVQCIVSDMQTDITVTDNGIGISEEDQDHLFSTFFRAKNAFNIQGTGLGLHIVKRYIDLLKGTIDLKSTLGKGTKINFIIPTNLQAYGQEDTGHR